MTFATIQPELRLSPPPEGAAEHFTVIPSPFPERKTVHIELAGLTYVCRFDPHPGSKRLVINLRGMWRRRTGPTPQVTAAKFARKTKSNVVSIWDPSLIKNPKIRSGIFLGTEESDPIVGVIAIALTLGVQLGLSRRRCVFWGSSGRGFAALMAASRMGTGAIVAGAQTDLSPLQHLKISKRIRAQFRRRITAEQLGREHPARASVIEAYRDALAAGRTPRFALIYNQFDHHHYREHLVPFCRAFGAPIGGVSADGLVLSRLVNHNGGHAVTKPMVKTMIRAITHATGDAARRAGRREKRHKAALTGNLSA